MGLVKAILNWLGPWVVCVQIVEDLNPESVV
jgi:hypothetical protein